MNKPGKLPGGWSQFISTEINDIDFPLFNFVQIHKARPISLYYIFTIKAKDFLKDNYYFDSFLKCNFFSVGYIYMRKIKFKKGQ